MTLLKTNGAGGELILPESNDVEWVQSVVSELNARLEVLDELWGDPDGYRILEECKTLTEGLIEYHGGA